MDLSNVMRTTFSARHFVDEPIPDSVVYDILEQARFAPSGGNRQGWRVIVLRDSETRGALPPLIEPTVRRYFAQMRAGECPFNTVEPSRVSREDAEAATIPRGFIDWVIDAPVLLVICLDLGVVASMDSDLSRVGVISGASIYPFVHNILLAARERGYAGTLTTFLATAEPEARSLLGIPEHCAIAALVPLGRPVKELTRLRRKPVESFAVRDRWDGESFGRT